MGDHTTRDVVAKLLTFALSLSSARGAEDRRAILGEIVEWADGIRWMAHE